MKTNGHDLRTHADNATRMEERRAAKEAKRKRAEALFASEPDLGCPAIAERLGVGTGTVSDWKKEFRARGAK